MKIVLLLVAGAGLCAAGDTRAWFEADALSFQKGTLTNLSVRSDGRLTLAPKTAELFDSSTAYLWTIARDSRGNVYTAGGPGARLFRIPPSGKGTSIAEFDALEIHAIAIDSKDRIYVGTAPDGKIYRVTPGGKTEEFYDPKQKYIWSMLTDHADNLYVATGDQGEVHRVTPEGKGEVFFKSDETHARSIALDRKGNLIVGTEPGGLIIRVSPKGEGFVIYQMAKREVTALAIGPANEIYAAAAGTKAAGIPASPAVPTPAKPASGNVLLGQSPNPGALPAPALTTVPGGSDIYRVTTDDIPEKLWTGSQDVVYALALDAQGKLLVASGNKGVLYRIENHSLYSTLASFPVAQITALMPGSDGGIYAATGNVGKLYQVGPGLEQEGVIESDVFDSGGLSMWGKISSGVDLHGGKVTISARSGNLDRPQQNWSPWSPATADPPAARFLQWKAVIAAEPDHATPSLDYVSAAYLRKNAAPRIDEIEITPANYKFPPPSVPLTISSNASITLPALGAPPAPVKNPDISTPTFTPAMQYAKGALGVRWSESDENGDTLIHNIEIRGEKEKNWRTLRDKIYEKYYSFDSTAFPDGDYRLRITVSDSPSNTPENALATSAESDPFTIDNTPPRITAFQRSGHTVRWHAADALSTIHRAEYSLDGGDWAVVDPVTKLSDSQTLDYALTLENLTGGEHTIAVRSTDDNDNIAVEKLVFTQQE